MNSSVCDGCIVVACVNRNTGFDVCSSAKYNKSPDKLLISKELAKGIFQIALTSIEIGGDVENNFITSMKCSGYIEKSELEIMVDEAEKIIKSYKESHSLGSNDINIMNNVLKEYNKIIPHLSNTIETLKKDHPEFKK